MPQVTEEACSCKKRKCERHGNCNACMEYHKDKKRAPYCFRKDAKRMENWEKLRVTAEKPLE